MNTTTTPTERHVHVDLDMDWEYKFHYRTEGRDGHRVILHRGDTITFTCSDECSIRFVGPSPFRETILYSRHSFITAHVRPEAPDGFYEYTLEVVKDDEIFTDPEPGRSSGNNPGIIIEGN